MMDQTSSSQSESESTNSEIESWEPSREERDLVRRSWCDDFDFLFNLGAAIYQEIRYTYIFEHNPHTKDLFPHIHRWGAEWRDSKEFRAQALKFVQTLSQVVTDIYHMDKLALYLYDVGARHVKFSARGFKPEYWDGFMDAMQVALADHISSLADFNEEQRLAAIMVWRRLALFIITHMKIGYNVTLTAAQERNISLP